MTAILKNWLTAICKVEVVQAIQEKLQTVFDDKFDGQATDQQPSRQVCPPILRDDIKTYTGRTDSEGRPHGEDVIITLQDDSTFQGSFINGCRKGWGTLTSNSSGQATTTTRGYFHNDVLIGCVVRTTKGNIDLR